MRGIAGRSIGACLAALWLLGSTAIPGRADDECLVEAFRRPPAPAKPWAYWWWLNANVTLESITRDLEQMKDKGIGGFLLFDIGLSSGPAYPRYPARRADFMSAPWRRLLKHAMSEAHRLGLQMSMNLSTSDGSLRAPWETSAQAPKALAWTSAEFVGPARVSCVMPPRRGPLAWDVALLAARIGSAEEAASPGSSPQRESEIRFDSDPKQWRPVNAPLAGDASALEVVDLTGEVDSQGRLAWNAGPGRWRILRFLYTVARSSRDVDMLDAAAVEAYFRRFLGIVAEDGGPLVGKTLTHVYSVSWEGATPTWSAGFEAEFTRYRGYALRPYLPVLAGITVDSPEISRRFVRDYSRTLSDCFMHNCYGRLTELCRAAGVRWHSESGGPWSKPDSLLFQEADALSLLGRNDMPQGEFWWKKRAGGGVNTRLVASAAHTYGKPLAAVEAFTDHSLHWAQYPATLKPNADAAFREGANFLLWHVFTASPAEFGRPGIEYTAGTHLNPNVTWWEEAGPFLAYLGRCQLMLRQGHFVADVCCYRSDRNYMPAVPGRAPPPYAMPEGYAFDLVNTEVLLDRLSVQGDRLVLPDGMHYRLLVVDPVDECLPLEALEKIVKLTQNGATVVLGPRAPHRTPGLKDYPACDERLRRLAAQLWGPAATRPSRRALGKGRVICGGEIGQVLMDEGLAPDCDGPWKYTHRNAGDLDIYFLAGTGEAECTLRVRGKEPELWDPLTGEVRGLLHRATADGRTAVTLTLPQDGSAFVVFRKPLQEPHLVSASGPKGGVEIDACDPSAAQVVLWKPGTYVFQASQQRQIACRAAPVDPLPLTGPWEVRFAPGWGAPESIVLDELVAWDAHPHPGIKHFSGTAAYRKSFRLDAGQCRHRVRLQLGDVRHVARVRINGADAGVAWTAPWLMELSEHVRPGDNHLEIELTNVWVNRLIGDAGLPEDKRFTRTNIGLQSAPFKKVYEGYSSQDPLVRSGLLGPVRLEFGQRCEVQLAGAGRAAPSPSSERKAAADPLPGDLEFLEVAGCRAFLLRPKKSGTGPRMPWVWYAPAFGGPHASHAWMLRQWLDKGIALAGVNVGESYGSPRGREVFTALWALLTTRYGMSDRPCLLPQSRGGLMLYNWAAENPTRVAAIAGIYTVCDLRSYPGVNRACGAYGLTAPQLEACLADHNPIDRLEPLAKARVPILHVHGDSDKVVPLEKNSGELARRYRALGGQVSLIVVPGKGHQVCDEFFHCQELVDFVTSAAQRSCAGK